MHSNRARVRRRTCGPGFQLGEGGSWGRGGAGLWRVLHPKPLCRWSMAVDLTRRLGGRHASLQPPRTSLHMLPMMITQVHGCQLNPQTGQQT